MPTKMCHNIKPLQAAVWLVEPILQWSHPDLHHVVKVIQIEADGERLLWFIMALKPDKGLLTSESESMWAFGLKSASSQIANTLHFLGTVQMKLRSSHSHTRSEQAPYCTSLNRVTRSSTALRRWAFWVGMVGADSEALRFGCRLVWHSGLPRSRVRKQR